MEYWHELILFFLLLCPSSIDHQLNSKTRTLNGMNPFIFLTLTLIVLVMLTHYTPIWATKVFHLPKCCYISLSLVFKSFSLPFLCMSYNAPCTCVVYFQHLWWVHARRAWQPIHLQKLHEHHILFPLFVDLWWCNNRNFIICIVKLDQKWPWWSCNQNWKH